VHFYFLFNVDIETIYIKQEKEDFGRHLVHFYFLFNVDIENIYIKQEKEDCGRPLFFLHPPWRSPLLFFSAMRYKAQGFPKGKALSLISHCKKRKKKKGGVQEKSSRERLSIPPEGGQMQGKYKGPAGKYKRMQPSADIPKGGSHSKGLFCRLFFSAP
jgi:hypothetical protein